MKLSDLDPDETLALVALIKAIVLTDGNVSAQETPLPSKRQGRRPVGRRP